MTYAPAPLNLGGSQGHGKLRVLSLFAGIGGFDLGLERTGGFETVAFCEIDSKARLVLAKHWPEVPCFDDVRELTAEQVGPVDVICGGFPCQDISIAWNGPGIDGARSGLWSEYARLIGELRPRYVIVENVAALLARGLGRVLGDLATLGYDAEWNCIPATYVGAPHRRDRLWIVAYPHGGQCLRPKRSVRARGDAASCRGEALAHPHCVGRDQVEQHVGGGASGERPISAAFYAGEPGRRGWWQVEPNVGRVADGVPARVDRLRQLGNAVVPQIPELIGNAILAAMHTPTPHRGNPGDAGDGVRGFHGTLNSAEREHNHG
jgi:DNA (cytosine-5)-methyltransferase 1